VYEVIRQTDLSVSQSERDLLNLESQAYDVVIIGNVSADHLRRRSNFLDRADAAEHDEGVGVMFLGGEYAYTGIPADLLPVKGGPVADALSPKGDPLVSFPAVPTPVGLIEDVQVRAGAGRARAEARPKEAWERA
jgi:hypothetical protein